MTSLCTRLVHTLVAVGPIDRQRPHVVQVAPRPASLIGERRLCDDLTDRGWQRVRRVEQGRIPLAR